MTIKASVTRLLKFRRSITGKLIIILLLFSALIIAAMAVATRLSFQEGFLEYVTEAELNTFDSTVDGLEKYYATHGSWAQLKRDRRIWERLMPHVQNLSSMPDGQYQGKRPPEGRDGFERPGPDQKNRALGGEPRKEPRDELRGELRVEPRGELRVEPRGQLRGGLPPLNDQAGVISRLRLLDKDKHWLTGPPKVTGHEELRAIYFNGAVVGWLSLTPIPLPIDGIDDQYQEEQLENILFIALGALTLAVLVGIPLGRRFVRPVKGVARGAHKLAEGRFDTRLDVHSDDELGQLANDFNALAAALERNEALRRQGMADTSHELRTPLALIRGEIEAMQDGIRPLDQPQLSKLHHSIMQLNSLVDDLYDLALTDAGALSYRKELLDLSEVLEVTLDSAGYSVRQAGLSLSTDISGVELPVFGDSRRLRQVIDNLLKNSRRYTDAKGQILVSAWRSDGWVKFRIEDSSPAVSVDVLPRLFERFYREEASRNRATGGAGLGLAICQNIIDAHQGTIDAEASPLGGLQITVSLPQAD